MASPPSVNNANYDLKIDKARKASSNDPGWKYGYWANLEKRDHVTCTLCDTIVSGGIKRLKQHLAGVYGDTKICPKATTAIRKEMRDYLESRKRKRPLFQDDDNEQQDEEEEADVVVVEANQVAESVQVQKDAPELTDSDLTDSEDAPNAPNDGGNNEAANNPDEFKDGY